MRQDKLIISILIVLCLVFISGNVFGDRSTQNIESRILETFDPDTKTSDWLVQGSKFITEGYPKYKTFGGVGYYPFALHGDQTGQETTIEILGMQAKFDHPGYNYLEIIPVKDGADGKVHNPLSIPGRVMEIDVWVWGSNYDFTLEAHVQDYRGFVHVLELGNLKFVGWQNLRIAIPSYIPQTTPKNPMAQQLQFVKFVVRTAPTEIVSGFEIYFDNIKVLTDIFESRFDGDKLLSGVWPEEEGSE